MDRSKEFPYGDILHRKHHVSPTRAKMSMIERAAQFAPFAALTGYDAAIRETARLTGQRIDLDESERTALDQKLQQLLPHLPEAPAVTVTHFVADLRKEGGSYVTTRASLRKIDLYRQCLILSPDQIIAMKDILDIQSDVLTE